jgi:hypothetical protein
MILGGVVKGLFEKGEVDLNHFRNCISDGEDILFRLKEIVVLLASNEARKVKDGLA